MITMGFVWITVTGCQNTRKGIKAEYKDLIEGVYASVTVEPKNYLPIYSHQPGIIEEIFVEEGDIVKKGSVLAVIENDYQLKSVQLAQKEKDIALRELTDSNNALKTLEIEIRNNKHNLTSDSIDYDRQSKLWSQDIGSKSEYEQREKRFLNSKEKLADSRVRYRQAVKAMNDKVEIANISYSQSSGRLEEFKIRANRDGKIYSINSDPGQFITTQHKFCTIGEPNDFVIKLFVDEKDISKIAVNQNVIIALDSYQEELFTGVVKKIYPSKNEINLTYQLDASFSDIPKNLMLGMTGEANIIVGEKPKVLTIPIIYLQEDNTVLTGDSTISIQTGLSDMEYIEVKYGLDTNTTIYLSDQ